MERRPLGDAGFDVPVIGFGTWQVFDVTGGDAVGRCRDVATTSLDAGADLFDTSPMYGEAERVLARVLEDRRADALVSTKVWASDDDEAERQIRHQLDWYGHLDVLFVHNLLGGEKRFRRVEQLKDEGKVRAVGVAHYTPRAFREIEEWMETGRVDVIQVPYNARTRDAEDRLLPLAETHRVAVVPNVPLGHGDLLRRAPPDEELARFESYGVTSWPQVLLKWLASDRRVTCAIPATTNPDHARQNAAAGDPPWFDERDRERVARLAGR